jgi:hypothetical protein
MYCQEIMKTATMHASMKPALKIEVESVLNEERLPLAMHPKSVVLT